MIQTKTEIIYGDRDEKFGKIMLEVRPLEMQKDGIKYLVIDWDISKEPPEPPELPEPWNSKEIFYTNEKINQLDEYLRANHDFSEMSKTEREWKKIQLSLMLDTQTNLFQSGKTIYRLNPDDWEFSE